MLTLVGVIASLGMIVFILLIILITVIISMAKMRAKFQTELRQAKSNAVYDEIGSITPWPLNDASIAKNIAYASVSYKVS